MIKHDYAPRPERKQENKAVTMLLFATFSFTGMMALCVLALAKTGPISFGTELAGWAGAVACVVTAAVGWNRKA